MNEITMADLEKKLVLMSEKEQLRYAFWIYINFIPYNLEYNILRPINNKNASDFERLPILDINYHNYLIFFFMDVFRILLEERNAKIDLSMLRLVSHGFYGNRENYINNKTKYLNTLISFAQKKLFNIIVSSKSLTIRDSSRVMLELKSFLESFFYISTFNKTISSQGKLEKILISYPNIFIENDKNDLLYSDMHLKEKLNSLNLSYWFQIMENYLLDIENTDILDAYKRISISNSLKNKGLYAVTNYLMDLKKQGGRAFNEARIIILGDKGAGKTCLSRRLIRQNAPMTTEDESTPGVDTHNLSLEEDELNISIWDFAGHTVTHAVHQFFLSEKCIYIIVIDGRTENVNRLEYWLNHVRIFGNNADIYILLNKKDKHKVKVPENLLKDKYNIKELITLNIKNDKNKLKDFREKLFSYIKTNPTWKLGEIPASNYDVKKEIENLFKDKSSSHEEEFISDEVFTTIAEKFKVNDKQELLERLHNLGIILWYKELEKYKTLILNPEWISYGVYSIINWANNNSKFRVYKSDFKSIFKSNRQKYPETKDDFLFDLMKHYELAYECEASSNSSLIIPHLLNEDRPKILPTFNTFDDLGIKYKFDIEPPAHTISRIIVKNHVDIKNFEVWKTGVVLEKSGSIALIKKNDREIEVFVKGLKKTEYFLQLRKSFDEVFSDYREAIPEMEIRYKVLHENTNYEVWLKENTVVTYTNKNRMYLEPNLEIDMDLSIPFKIYGLDENKGGGIMAIINNFNGSGVTNLAQGSQDTSFTQENIQINNSVNSDTKDIVSLFLENLKNIPTGAIPEEKRVEIVELVESLKEESEKEQPKKTIGKSFLSSLSTLKDVFVAVPAMATEFSNVLDYFNKLYL